MNSLCFILLISYPGLFVYVAYEEDQVPGPEQNGAEDEKEEEEEEEEDQAEPEEVEIWWNRYIDRVPYFHQ